MEALFDILLKEGFWFAVIRSTTPILLTTLGAMTNKKCKSHKEIFET